MDLLRTRDTWRGLAGRLRRCARPAACRHAQARCPDSALHGPGRAGSTTRREPRPHSGARRRGPGAAGRQLRSLRRVIGEHGGAQQLLHGEPHPGNLLTTKNGLLFIDLETCCRGPVEFDLAHAPEEVGAHYPGVDQDLLRACRILVLAMITTWRWDRGDQYPNGRRLGAEWLGQIRAALDRDGGLGLDTHG
ncbi:phosphotransferase [Streptomyces sp. FIT100]|nr:phosphotransferase [Streptomyces sp. FIT100]